MNRAGLCREASHDIGELLYPSRKITPAGGLGARRRFRTVIDHLDILRQPQDIEAAWAMLVRRALA